MKKMDEPKREYMVAAVVVLYHPELSLLTRLLDSLIGQVNAVIVVDNTPAPSADFAGVLARYGDQVSYVPLGDNMGIATAQNVGIRKGLSAGHSHVLLLDQDSVPPRDMVQKLLSAEQGLLESGIDVGCVGPIFIDEKTGETCRAIRHGWLHVNKVRVNTRMEEPVEADYLIASGSLTRASTLERVGLMLDELFIDRVDIEWGLRAGSAGSQNFLVPSAVMSHSIGDSWVHAFGKDITMHSDTRHYYIVRNSTYLLRIKSMGWKWRTMTLLMIPFYVYFYSWHSAHRGDSFRLMFKAVVDGVRGQMGRLA